MKKALIGVGIAAAAAVAAFVLFSSDEPPIRVRNGSMILHAAEDSAAQKTWRWERQDSDSDEPEPSYSHEPNHLDPQLGSQLWVKVQPGTGTYSCDGAQTIGSAPNVFIDYGSASDKVTVRFKRSKRTTFASRRTKVRPEGSLKLVDAATLQVPGEHFITEVRAGSLRCTFGTKESLTMIYICSTESVCQSAGPS